MTAFFRFNTLMALAAAAMSSASALGNPVTRQEALSMHGGYQSRGKGKTATHNAGGTRMHQRAAMKKRNVAKNRRAHR